MLETLVDVYTKAQFIFISSAIIGWFAIFVYCKARKGKAPTPKEVS